MDLTASGARSRCRAVYLVVLLAVLGQGCDEKACLMSADHPDRSQTTRKHPLEEDVTLSDGTVVRVTGLYAVQFRKDPAATLPIIEEDYYRARGRQKPVENQNG
jgi:hypothetical protein